MKFLEMVQKLQQEHKGKLVIVQCGIFYIGVGKDAIILNKLINLELTCYTKSICKAGFPENALSKYIKLLQASNISVVVYGYTDKTESTLECCGKRHDILLNVVGGEIIEKKQCTDCKSCKHRKKENKDEDYVVIMNTLKTLEETVNSRLDKILKQIEEVIPDERE